MKTYQILVSKHFTSKTKLGEVLQKVTSFDFKILADAAAKGAVWFQKQGKGKILRIRSLHLEMDPKDKITFYYDPKILSIPEITEADCLYESSHYSIWFKAAGVLPQGTQTSDHTSLLRYVERIRKKDVYLVHRLDRETAGLMIIGHTSEAAAKLGDLFQKNKIQKTYEAIVKGQLERGLKHTINDSLDGKAATTHFEVLANDETKSLLRLTIETGRLHQIRRHLEAYGYPVMGDPKYGKGNKNRQGLQLLARSLSFIDPWSRSEVVAHLESGLTLQNNKT